MTHTKKYLSIITPLQWLIVGLVVVGTIGLVKFFGRTSTTIDRYVVLQITAKDWKFANENNNDLAAPEWIVDSLRKSPQSYSAAGQAKASIIRASAYQMNSEKMLAYAQLKLVGYVNKKTNAFIYNNQTIVSGAHITINTDTATLMGNIIRISDKPIEDNHQTITFTARIESIKPWKSKGIQNLNYRELISEQPILTIKSSVPRAPINTLFLTPLLKNDPEVIDVDIEGEMSVSQINNRFYFTDSQPVQIGSKVTFNDPFYGTYTAEIKTITEK